MGCTEVEWATIPSSRSALFINGRACISAGQLHAIEAQEGDAVLVLRGDGTPPCVCVAQVGRDGEK